MNSDTTGGRQKRATTIALAIGGVGVLASVMVAFAAKQVANPALQGGHVHSNTGSANFFDNIAKVYTPRVQCMFHETPVIWLHMISDLIIGLAYFSIPVVLVTFVRKRRDIPLNWIFFLFAGFILACGTTHFVSVWNLWEPLYKLDGIIKAVTALLSIFTAVALWPMIPVALSVPSPALLEQKVAERTQELAKVNEELRAAIQARDAFEREREDLLRREKAARNEAERTNRIKDDFLATLSHELRTPLTAILGWSHILRKKPSPDSEINDGLAIIERNAQVQTSLIEDLLDMSRIVSGKMQVEIRDLDFVEIVRAAIETIRPAAVAKQIELSLTLGVHTLPTTGDPNRLQQVVWNLLSNAVKFTRQGGTVQVDLTREGSDAILSVTDDGVGIDPEFQPQVFQRFIQADSSTTRRFGGLGIGLAIVQNVTELHGGTVQLQSAGKDQGSTFIVRLPLNVLKADDGSAIAQGKAWTGLADDRLLGARILVVDDEPDTRSLLRELLDAKGATVTVAGSAEEALGIFAEFNPDVLLSDVGMPEKDGYQLLSEIRARSQVAAVAVTAFARPEDRIKALRAGFDDYVSKPIDPDELVTVVAASLRRGV